MSSRFIVALLVSAAALHAAKGKDQALSPADIAKITRICRQFVGFPIASEQKLFEQLVPFLRTRSELEHQIVDCSSQHCNGSVRLRDNAQVLYRYVHVPPERSKIGPGDLTPDIEYKGNNRFVAVALIRHGKIVYSKGWLPEWFKDQHLHRAGSPKTSNQSLQPTALWRCASKSILISVFSVVAQPRSRSGG